MESQRPFNPDALSASSLALIRARIGGGAVVWRYTVLLPIDETRAGQQTQQIATGEDQAALEELLANQFEGVTVFLETTGFGLRDGQVEQNSNIPYVVYGAPITETELYFHALKNALQAALVQETILIERQEVWILKAGSRIGVNHPPWNDGFGGEVSGGHREKAGSSI